jgi:aspartyl-tRNA(Asn)/glutamyl-tRNA(Gln) amidotransferase subunit B
MFRTGMGARDVMLKKGISFLTSERDLEKVVREVIEKNPQSVADYLRGKEKALHFLIGQVMRVTKGQASPEVVKNLLLRELSGGE